MKHKVITLLLLLTALIGFSQDLRYDVRGAYTHSVTKEKLSRAKIIRDVNPLYPVNWITEADYISVKISATTNGKAMTAMGTNETLTLEQKNMLAIADLNTDVIVDVNFKHKNPVTGIMDIRVMHFTYTVIPEIEAIYPGGYQELIDFVKENAIDRISAATSSSYKGAVVKFTINESGQIANVRLGKTSDDKTTDQLLLETIIKMPTWKAAENAKGNKVKQDFEFQVNNVSMDGC